MSVPFFREAGSGPGVICLHANASNSSQWRSLMDRLAPRFRVLAPDLRGAGRTPAWSTGRPIRLSDEAAALEPVFERAGEPFVLIGHSYGAAVALIAALEQPRRVRALALYEPTLFSLVDAETPPPNDADAIKAVVTRSFEALDAGSPDRAAEHFIDFWMGAGSWALMPASRKEAIVATIVNIRDWASALLHEPAPLEAFAALRIPALFMTGQASPAPSLAVARLLAGTLPQVEVVDFPGLGHMGPVTHPDAVNDAISRFLERL